MQIFRQALLHNVLQQLLVGHPHYVSYIFLFNLFFTFNEKYFPLVETTQQTVRYTVT